MTISVVQTKDAAGTGAGTQTLNFASGVSAGNSVILWVGDFNSSSLVVSMPTAPTYNGGAVTGAVKLIDAQDTGAANVMYSAIWLLPNVQSSGTSVAFSVTNGLSNANSHFCIAEVAGLGTAPVADAASPSTHTGTGIAGGVLSSGATGNAVGAPGMALGAMSQTGNTGWGVPAGWTAITTSARPGAGYQIFTSSGSSYTWNPTGTAAGQWSAAVALIDAGGAAPPAVQQFVYQMRMM